MKRLLPLLLAVVASSGPLSAASPASTTAATPAPPLPAIRALELEPARLQLEDGRDERRVLVWGIRADGGKIDLTAQARFSSTSDVVSVVADNFIHPLRKGEASVAVTAGGRTISLPVRVMDDRVPDIRFVRDVEPMLSRVGCNAGTCHGSANGKNGFKLSLRGYNPDFDYQALINDISGRRFNRVRVDESLMLLKPLAEVPHEGRQAIRPGSREHHLLRDWIAQGAKPETLEAGRAKKIEVLPAIVEMDLAGRTQHLIVLATYADGTTRDVTREAVFSVNNTEVAETGNGWVRGLRRGEAAVLVRYEGHYSTRLLTVMGERSQYKWAGYPAHNYIDHAVAAKWQRMKILPSDLCDDADFIRRVSLDLTGTPARAEKVRAFLADKSDTRQKREQLIDELIGSPEFIEYWANKWADLLQCNSTSLGQKGVWVYRQWIRQAVAGNVPYDQFVRELLLANGSTYQQPAANYFRVLREPGKITEDVSQTFLGVRFNCNKCHDHPFEKWTQNQYYEFGAYFAQVALKKGSLPGEEVVYRNYNGGEVKHLRTDMAVAAKVPFGHTPDVAPNTDGRAAFVAWLTDRENPLFAKSMANRLWSYFLGRGIIEPVDDIRASNPPSNPELLDQLTADFVKSNFDLRQLMRTICRSRTYQLSIVANPFNADDTINFSHALPRRLTAEQMLDAVAVATGSRPQFNGLPAGTRAVQIPDGMVAGNDFLTLFGRPTRQSACECERGTTMTLSHALNMINGPTLSDAINAPDNQLARLVKAEPDNGKVIESIYLACLNRFPKGGEKTAVDLGSGPQRLEVAQDLAWALINSPAFIFNR